MRLKKKKKVSKVIFVFAVLLKEVSNTNSATSFERIKTPFHNTKKKAISRFKYCFCSCETQGVLISDKILTSWWGSGLKSANKSFKMAK